METAGAFRRSNLIKKKLDAIIAVTAKVNKLLLITRDKDFESVVGFEKNILE